RAGRSAWSYLRGLEHPRAFGFARLRREFVELREGREDRGEEAALQLGDLSRTAAVLLDAAQEVESRRLHPFVQLGRVLPAHLGPNPGEEVTEPAEGRLRPWVRHEQPVLVRRAAPRRLDDGGKRGGHAQADA